MTRSAPWFLLVVCLAGIFLARESRRGGYGGGVDREFFDWLIANARLPPGIRNGVHPTVTLVEIDDTIAATNGRVPLSPLEYASFLKAVGKYEPAVVAIEPILDWPQMPPGTEEILAEQALLVPKLLLGIELGSNPGASRDPSILTALGKVSGDRSHLPEFPEIVNSPGSRIQELAAASGVTNLPGLAGVPIRYFPLLQLCRERVAPSFALQALILWLRLAPSEVSVHLGSHVQLGETFRLPIDDEGRSLLDARVFGSIHRINLDELALLATRQASPASKAAAEAMRNGIVILGGTTRGARTLELPGGRQVSPAEVMAWAVASLERTPPTRRAGPLWDGGIILLWLVIGWRLLSRPRVPAVAVVCLVFAAYGLAALSIFEMERLWLPCALPLGLGIVVAGLLWIAPRDGMQPAAATASDAQIDGL